MNYNQDGDYTDGFHEVTITDNCTHAEIDGKDYYGTKVNILNRVEDTFNEE